MNNWFRLIVWSILLAGCWATFPIGDSSGQDRPPGISLNSLRFKKRVDASPPEKKLSYAGGNFDTDYQGGGRGSIGGVNFLADKYEYSFGTSFSLATGDLIGLLGGVFRAECFDKHAVLERIPDEKAPKGAKVPKWDSITVPLHGSTGLSKAEPASISLLDVKDRDEESARASLRITLGVQKKPKSLGIPETLYATVKPGDYLLLRDRGYKVVEIIPHNQKTRVVGWVEIAPEPIPEADLIRGKMAFVRPTLKQEP